MCGDITCGNEIRKPTKLSVASLNVGHGCVTLQSGHIITEAITVDCFQLSFGTIEHNSPKPFCYEFFV